MSLMRRAVGRFAALAGVLGLSACALGTSFQPADRQRLAALRADPQARVVLSVTHVTLKPDRAARAPFWEHVERVEASLQGQPGFIGHAKRFEPLGTDAWTLTVWEDEASLRRFLDGPVHRAAVRAGAQSWDDARFARAEAPAAQLPPSWETAFEILERNGRRYYE